jgi:transposase
VRRASSRRPLRRRVLAHDPPAGHRAASRSCASSGQRTSARRTNPIARACARPLGKSTAPIRSPKACTALLRERCGEERDTWVAVAQMSGSAPLQRCACGLLADTAAGQAGLTRAWSQGQVAGHIQRLKLIKRRRYGRAGFAVLRRRVLTAA